MRVKSVLEDAKFDYSIYAAASKNTIYLLRLEDDFSEVSVIQHFTLFEGEVKLFSISLNQELFTVCGEESKSKFISCRPLTQLSHPTTSILRP